MQIINKKVAYKRVAFVEAGDTRGESRRALRLQGHSFLLERTHLKSFIPKFAIIKEL